MKTSLPHLYQHSQQLRKQAVACLQGMHPPSERGRSLFPLSRRNKHQHQLQHHHKNDNNHNPHSLQQEQQQSTQQQSTPPPPPPPMIRMKNKRLVLQGQESVSSRELVEAAARQYGLTSEEYCQDMLQESVWGGGPEIVALANVLQRPIHVYELRTTTTTTTSRTQSPSPTRHHKSDFSEVMEEEEDDDDEHLWDSHCDDSFRSLLSAKE